MTSNFPESQPQPPIQNQQPVQPTQTEQAEPQQAPMKQRLQDLVNEVDPDEQLDEDVEQILIEIADEFIENVVSSSCAIAKHRNSSTLDVDDVKLYLDRKFKLWVPGFGDNPQRPKSFTSEAHRQRMALIASTVGSKSGQINK